MRVISVKKLREFWTDTPYRAAESPLRTWYQTVRAADWTCFADVRKTYTTADQVGNKVVFDIGGNKYRLIVVIDYEGHKVFVRHVLDHEEYDKGRWKPRARQPRGDSTPKTENGKGSAPTKRRKRRKKK
jgi:mRNA interferase HigB